MLDIELGSIKKFYYKHSNSEKVVVGVYADNIIYSNTPYILILGIEENGAIIMDKVESANVTYTATKLDPVIREKLADIYDTYQKKQKIEERKKKYTNEINDLKNKIYELQNTSQKIDNMLQSKLTKIANKKGFISQTQFVSAVKSYLSKSFLNERDKFSIYNSNLVIKREEEVDRIPLTQVESYGLGYVHHDGGFEQNSYEDVKDYALVKSWASKVSFKRDVAKSLVEDDFSYGDKGHVYFISCIIVPLKKSLTNEYAKEIAYQILGKKLTTRKTKK